MYEIFLQLFKLLVFDAAVALAFFLFAFLVKRVKCASHAVMQRDFAGYFSSPTGYVFICVFMLLSAACAFWFEEFFTSNLANLDQLNKYIPLVLLVLIPAITMSVWAEERREGTDELLLTIPASDVDIVLGKYLAAVAIFSVALLLSQLANFFVLLNLSIGDMDVGLFIATYVGYWFMGIAMLALGMAASFFTSNLTVSFVLGALINVPLVALRYADSFLPDRMLAESVSWASYLTRFNDFGRGVISWSSISFFVLVAVLGVYLCTILIGRRHWYVARDKDWWSTVLTIALFLLVAILAISLVYQLPVLLNVAITGFGVVFLAHVIIRFLQGGRASMLEHYLVRAIAMLAICTGASRFFSNHDVLRFDATSAKVSSLSGDTKKILRGLNTDQPILVDAFISRSVPEQYAKTKIDLVNMLREFDALAGADIEIRLNDNLDTFSEEAQRAEDQYGITPQTVRYQARGGSVKEEELFMGAAFTCGLERVVIPFFDRGIPVEYELVRSIATVAKAKRLKIGVVKTDAAMFGSFNPMMGGSRGKELIIQELEKQYEVEEVTISENPGDRLEVGLYDVLLVVQPSTLTAPQMSQLVTAIRDGQPTAVFEDPFPYMMPGASATSQPREQPGGQMAMLMGGGRPPTPKGDIRQLWDVLGIDMVAGEQPATGGLVDARIVWQNYNPYAGKIQISDLTPEWVFVSPDAPGVGNDAFNKRDPISSGLNQILFLYPGAIRDLGTRKFDFQPLVMTGDESGEIGYDELRSGMQNRNERLLKYARAQGLTKKRYIVGARIRGEWKGDYQMSDAGLRQLAQASGPNPDALPTSNDDSADDKSSEESADGEKRNTEVHVVYVCDIDLLSSAFLSIRAQTDDQIGWDFDNVTFILNILDSLAGDERLVAIRKRKPRHSTLKMVMQKNEDARAESLERMSKFKAEYDEKKEAAEQRMNDRISEVDDEIAELMANPNDMDKRRKLMELQQKKAIYARVEQQKFDAEVARLEKERNRELKKIERDLELDIRKTEASFKFFYAFLPCLLPLLIGLFVWAYRLGNEKRGVQASRLR